MIEVAKVSKIEDKYCTVTIDRKTACDSCRMCAFKENAKTVDIRVENTLNCNVGENVEIEMSNKTVLFASFLVYILPLIFGAVFLIASIKLFDSEGIWGLLTLLGVVIGFVIALILGKKYKNKFEIAMIKISNEDIHK